jgi:tetratricopeptide (TPR) repeat protein
MALARAEAMVPEAPAVVELQAELAAAQSEQRREPAQPNPKVIDFAAAAQLSRASLPAAFTPDPSDEPEAAALLSDSLTASGESSQIPSPKREPQQSLVPPSAVAESSTAVSTGEAVQEDPWNATGMLDGLAADLERSLASDFLADSPTEPPTPAAETLAAAQPAAAEFMTAPPAVPFATQNPHPVSPKPGETRVGHPTSPEPSATSTPVAEAEAFDPTSALSSLFDEFKRELETPNSEVGDDVETHYNLGLAFKEMGLVDEAIAEFQKAAAAVERGNSFPQVLETYTWLADCFVTKGVPEAGMRWYKKALALPDLSAEQTLALHYELACAEQAAGDLASARNHFLHVLSLNIDYRDVTERIKGLTS